MVEAYTGFKPIVFAYSSFPIGQTGLFPVELVAEVADEGDVAADELLLLGGLKLGFFSRGMLNFAFRSIFNRGISA